MQDGAALEPSMSDEYYVENGYQTLSTWRADFDRFQMFFLGKARRYCNQYGYILYPDGEALKIAHASWIAACDHWQKEKVAATSGPLSHIKVLSLLLHHLVSAKWAPSIHDHLPKDDRLWEGRVHIRDHVRKCLNAGRGNYLAFQFVITIINIFERDRIDHSEPFIFRLTQDLEHDLMVYFDSEKQDELSTYLILKALYSRPGGNGN
jgi:hypothetical protein